MQLKNNKMNTNIVTIQIEKQNIKGFILYFLLFFGCASSMHNLSSLTRDRTQAPCSGNMESKPLNHQESLYIFKQSGNVFFCKV